MRKLLLFITVLAGGALAQEGDSAAGKEVFQAQCVSCHGQGGASAIPANPILSGQHFDYLRKQTAAYRDGQRKNPVMAGMAKGLSDQQIADIARYLSEQPPVIVGAADMDSAMLAEQLYRHGAAARGLSACAACHGPAGGGIAALAPRLSGQYPDYTAAALRAYASGERHNAQMNSIAALLSEEEIKQLAEFISGLSH